MAKILIGPALYMGERTLPGVISNHNGTLPSKERFVDTVATNSTSIVGGGDGWATVAANQYHLICSDTTAPTYNKFLAGGPTGTTRLNIYSGSRPEISTMTSLAAFTSQLLISFSIPAYSPDLSITGFRIVSDLSFLAGSGNSAVIPSDHPSSELIVGICPTPTAATATGTATWFWFGNYTTPTNLSGKSFITGSVGDLNSSADLRIQSTPLVAGQNYTSDGVRLSFPTLIHSD